MRRYFLVGGIILALCLGVYSWNRRTGVLDFAAENIGLELSAWILEPWRKAQDFILDYWNRYIDLVEVRDENLRLKNRIDELEALLVSKGEDLAELERLRALVQFPVDRRWQTLAAKVLAGKMGPNAVLDSITISRGYVTGAKPGTPLVTNLGLVGRILRSSPHASTALLLTDPDSKVAVFGQQSRAPGILKGQGQDKPLEVEFVRRNTGMLEGEILITSGLDDKYPKGLPVGRVTSVAPSNYTQFMTVTADPLVDFEHLEEVLLLEKKDFTEPVKTIDIISDELVGPPLPPNFVKVLKNADSEIESASVAEDNPQPSEQGASATSAQQSTSTSPAQTASENASWSEKRKPAQSVQAQPGNPDGKNIPRNREGAPMYRIITP